MVDAARRNPGAPAPLDRVVPADDDRSAWCESPHQVSEQAARTVPNTLGDTAQDTMIVGEVPVSRMAGDLQPACRRAASQSQDGTNQHHLCAQPRALGKKRCEGDDDRSKASGQVRHGGVPGRKRR